MFSTGKSEEVLNRQMFCIYQKKRSLNMNGNRFPILVPRPVTIRICQEFNKNSTVRNDRLSDTRSFSESTHVDSRRLFESLFQEVDDHFDSVKIRCFFNCGICQKLVQFFLIDMMHAFFEQQDTIIG